MEGPRLLKGKGRFVADLAVPDRLEAVFVRSTSPHARISVDVGPALRAGAVGAWSGTDSTMQIALAPPVQGAAGGPESHGDGEGEPMPPQPILARGEVRYVGEPVAMVVGRDRYEAEDLADLVRVDYEPLAVVDSSEAALAPDGAAVHAGRSNVFLETSFSTDGVEAAFRAATHLVRATLRTRRQGAVPLETRGLLAVPGPDGGSLTVHASTQFAHGLRDEIARLLGLGVNRVRVVLPDVGGAFGMKAQIYPEDIAVCCVALSLGRPVRWISDRHEAFVSDAQARDDVHVAEAACDREGRILALRDDIVADGGAYQAYPESGAVGETMMAASMLPGPYRVPEYAYRIRCTYTHRTPTGAYRGVWGPIATEVQEALIQAIAEATGQNALEVRRRNLIGPDAFPYKTVTGNTYDSGNYGLLMDLTLERADAAGFAARRRESEARGLQRGLGLSVFVEPAVFAGSEGPGYEMARVDMDPGGTVRIAVGTAPSGQGHETAFAQWAADRLGVPMDWIEVRAGDTSLVPYGGGTGGSRSLVLGGGAVLKAADAVAARLRAIAGFNLEADPEDIVLENGMAHVEGVPDRTLSIGELARIAYLHGRRRPKEMEAGLSETVSYRTARSITFPFGCHVAEVEVDPETGIVRVVRYTAGEDCGPQLNPALVEGQILGGVAQGIGSVLLEHLPYDTAAQPLATTFLDYLIPGPEDVPSVTVVSTVTPSPFTPMGVKGVGEAALIAAPAALALALEDATKRKVTRLPMEVSEICRRTGSR